MRGGGLCIIRVARGAKDWLFTLPRPFFHTSFPRRQESSGRSDSYVTVTRLLHATAEEIFWLRVVQQTLVACR